MLNETAVHLLPTLMAADAERTSRTMPRGNPTLVGALLPTPTVADSRGTRNSTSGRKAGSKHHDGSTLLDVFWNGDPTSPPSDDGNGSSDDPHPHLPLPVSAAEGS